MKPKILLWVFVASAVVSCAGGAARVSPDYRGKSLNADILHVQLLPVEMDPAIETNYAFVSVRDSGEAGYVSFFKKNFPEFAERYSAFRSVVFADDVKKFIRMEMELDHNDTVFLDVPDTTEDSYLPGNENSYTLLIENMLVYRKKGSADRLFPQSGPGIFIGDNTTRLCHSGRFLVWDDRGRKIVLYGEIDIEIKIESGGVERAAITALEEMAKLIFLDGPFRRAS